MSDENVEGNETAHAEVNETEKQMTGDEIANMPLSGESAPAPEPNMEMAKAVGLDSENKDRFNDDIDEDKVILYNDKVCEGDLAVDMLQAANERGCIAEAKVEKLKRLMLLTDKGVSHIVGGVIQNIQWAEFCKAFPDEK